LTIFTRKETRETLKGGLKRFSAGSLQHNTLKKLVIAHAIRITQVILFYSQLTILSLKVTTNELNQQQANQSFIHSFILETYIAPLQETTTQRRSLISH